MRESRALPFRSFTRPRRKYSGPRPAAGQGAQRGAAAETALDLDLADAGDLGRGGLGGSNPTASGPGRRHRTVGATGPPWLPETGAAPAPPRPRPELKALDEAKGRPELKASDELKAGAEGPWMRRRARCLRRRPAPYPPPRAAIRGTMRYLRAGPHPPLIFLHFLWEPAYVLKWA